MRASLQALLLLAPILLLPVALALGVRREEATFRPERVTRMLELVVTSPQWEGILFEFEEGFRRYSVAKDGADVAIRWLNQGGGTKTLRWIEEQFAVRPDGIDVDVMFGGGTDPYEALKRAGLLERYDPPPEILAGIPQHLAGFPIVDPDRTWFGSCLTSFGIMTNERVFELVPALAGLRVETWEDLADPRLHGFVGSADPRSSSSYHTFYEILLQAFGFEDGMFLARRIGGNIRTYTKFSAELPKLCAVGQVACAPSIDQYALAQVDHVGGGVCRYVLPAGKTLVNPDAAAILKGARNGEAARRFIDFLLSEEAARLWMLRKGEPGGPRRHSLNRLAIRPAIYDEVRGRTHLADDPFARDSTIEYDYERASRRWTILNDALGALLIDTGPELARAMAAYHRLSGARREQAEALLRELPFDEDELMELAQGRFRDDEAFRNRTIAQWGAFARERCERVLRLAAEAPQ